MVQRRPIDFAPPEQIEEYRILRPIGRGGMGVVYLGHDVLLDRPVAVKFISARSPDAQAQMRFLIEARAIARLTHPNVVSIYRVGSIEGRPFLVSELVRGQSLNQIQKPLPWERALQIGLGLSRGLGVAHRLGVLHRDIKPANAILQTDGEVKLLDFGLAKILDVLPPEGADPVDVPASEENVGGGAGVVVVGSATSGQKPPISAWAETLTGDDPQGGDTDFGQTSVTPRSGSITRVGAIMGTPLYMAPEVLRGEPATRRSDVYSLGMLIYELCAGQPPGLEGSGDSHLTGRGGDDVRPDPPPISIAVPGIDPGLAAIVDRCLRQDPGLRFASGDDLRDALERLERFESLAPEAWTVLAGDNPYRGLAAFQAEHSSLFFGRGAEVRAVLDRVRTSPLLVVAGDSGVGKSSLCRAGVLPLVQRGALADGRMFTIVELVPGRHPVAALAAALALRSGPAAEADTRQADLLRVLARDPAAFSAWLHDHRGEGAGTLLFIDQVEELFSLSDPREAAIIGQVLGDLIVSTSGVRVLLTIRGDFLTRLAALPGIGELLSGALWFLRPLLADSIRQAIVGPARSQGVTFESDALVSTLVESSAGAAGGLPLLQFALTELWEARDPVRQVIPASALTAIGGVEGCLARHADGVLAALRPEQRARAHRLLLKLVTAEGLRARRPRSELVTDDPGARDPAEAAIEALVRSRLLVASQSEGATTYELAHEALIGGWGTLRGWLDSAAGPRMIHRRIELAAAEWDRIGRAREALWRDRQLDEVREIEPRTLEGRERDFLTASRDAARRRRLIFGGGLGGALLLGALVYGGVQFKLRHDLDRVIATHVEQARRDREKARLLDRDIEASRKDAFALFDRPAQGRRDAAEDPAARREEAERRWSRVLGLERQLDLLDVGATQALESALALDGQSKEVRRLLADVTYSRILHVERARHPAQQEELLHRLSNHDERDQRRRRLETAALLSLVTAPPATVSLRRYEDDPDGYRQAGPAVMLGQTPLSRVPVLPGSYLLTFASPGRPEMRYPLLTTRGEVLVFSLSLPSSDAVPPGFVYVPPGRFLFGSADDETLRRSFLDAPPLHPMRTAGYLIGREEVTFADWIDFLRDLPAAERRHRLPQVRPSMHNQRGMLELSESPGGAFYLSIQPTLQAYRARAGERIRYPGRRLRQEQDWLRFPVTGVSFEDVQAYLSWLDRSGHVPGARLCDEYEWERAARGADDRVFPHGNRLAPDDANFDLTYGRQPLSFGPDEVGAHPVSQSPFGLNDMAGNALEWTRSVRVIGEAVVRGGGWYYDQMTSRSANRQVGEAANLRDILVGLRVCADYPPGQAPAQDRGADPGPDGHVE